MNNLENKDLVPPLRFPEFQRKESWKIKPFKNIFDRLTDKNQENNQNVLTISAQLGLVSQLEYFNKKVSAKDVSGYYLLQKGDFAYNKSYSKGYPMGAIKSLKKYDKGVVSTLYICFRAKKGYRKLFFEQYFDAGTINSELVKIAQEGGRAHGLLNVSVKEFFENIYLYIPKPKEQQKIADCLSSIDELVTAERQKLAALKAHRKGLMQQLFPAEGKKVPELRFSEFQSCGNWQKRAFSTLFEIGGGKDHKRLIDGDIPVYGSGGYMRSVNEYLYDGESACIGRKGTINKPMFLSGKFWTVDTLFYTHSFQGCLPKFVFLLFQNVNWLKLNEAGGVPSLSKIIINNVEVFIPRIEEQQKITNFITSIDDLITAQAQKIASLKIHKKGLMQQLFPTTVEIDA